MSPTKCLLCDLRYLNRDTFGSDEQEDPYGSAQLSRNADGELAKEVREALAAGQRFLLIHENDLDLRGCEFAYFFQITPQDLVSSGLYRSMAVPWYPGMYRPASMKIALASLAANAGEVDDAVGTQVVSCESEILIDAPPSSKLRRLFLSPLVSRRVRVDASLLSSARL